MRTQSAFAEGRALATQSTIHVGQKPGAWVIERWRSSYRIWMPWIIALTIVCGLLIDQHFDTYGQIAVDTWTWAMFGLLLSLVTPSERPALIACLLIATIGEVVLSLVWGLYIYRLHNIPLFVPPGHVLLFWLGIQLSARLPYALLRAVAPVSAVVIVGLAFAGLDWFSVPLLGLFLLCWRFGPAARLYATMFVLSFVMEMCGTSIGNWTWQSHVPWLAWPTTNPPLAAGAFYCALDLLVMLAIGQRKKSVA
ncbi:MAG TPA: hypothetical protein VFW00_02420 [Rhodocyclaceae bacterium]|nr:hypothetical protein [Rhodocyclaceae bacterium]